MSTLPPGPVPPPPAAHSGTDHDALPAGTRFGEFEIIRVLGVGGFGIVYLANDHSLEREVALKEYMPASLAARGLGPQITVRSSSFAETYAIGLRSFVNEARLLARFDHPSLVKVYRFWEDNATAYMVMPFLQGTTLRDTRRRMAHPPDEAWIRSVINPILSALELLHREGVYHRDIAPDNILLPPDGPPVLLDFGAARRVISDRTQSLTAILKPSYAPIEQYAEMTQLRQGPWTDLYALGAVIHYLMFGVPPAPATARAVQDDADQIENRIVPGVSPKFLEAVAWMLSIRPNQRPQSGEQLRAVLDGNAAIPPRGGRPGITIPPVATSGAAPTGQTQPPTRAQERPPEPTLMPTAHMPTYLPTAHVAPPGAPRATTFSPTAQMPSPRVAASRIDPPPVATQPPPVTDAQAMPPQHGPATIPPPRGPATLPPSRGSATVPPPHGPATLPPAYATATQPPHGPSTLPPHAADWAVSRPATLPPPLPGAPSQFAHATLPPAARTPPPTRPAPLPSAPDAATAPPGAVKPASSKLGLVVVGVVAVLIVGGAAAWQILGKRGGAAEGASAAAASAAAISAAVGTSPPVVAPDTSTAAKPAARETSPPAVVADVPAKTDAQSTTSTVPRAGTALGSTPSTAGASPSTTTTAATQATTSSTRQTATDRTALPAERSNAGDRATATVDPASTRGRPIGRPVPRAGDLDAAAAGTANGAANLPGIGDKARPLGSPALAGRPVPTLPQVRAQAPTTPTPQSPPQQQAEAAPASAREACGKRVFIALAVCMDDRCEEPRFRGTAECVGILERKRERENR